MDEYLTPDEVAKILKISEKVMVDLLNSGDIPGIKIGYLWRISKERLEEYLESNMNHAKFTKLTVQIKPTKVIDESSLMERQNLNIGQYLTCDDVAERYGVRKITVWAWIRGKRLNAIQTGKFYRIRREDLKAFEEVRYTKK